MKLVIQAMLGLSLAVAGPVFAANTTPAGQSAAPAAAHVKAVQDLLGAMQVENVLRGVASRSRYASEAQRQAVFAKIARIPPAEIHQRLAPQLVHVISADTATEMTRFYNTPYGKKVIYGKYNSRGGIIMVDLKPVVPPEEQKERKRPAYVRASKELADAEPVIDHEAFKLLQQIDKEKR